MTIKRPPTPKIVSKMVCAAANAVTHAFRLKITNCFVVQFCELGRSDES